MNRGTSERSETSAQDGLMRQIWFCFVYFCSEIIWKVILKRGQNKFHKNRQSRFEFSSRRTFRTRSWKCCNTFSWWLIFRVRLLGAQSSCRHCVNIMLSCQWTEPFSQKRRGSVHPRQGIPLTSYARKLMSYKHISNVFTLPLNEHPSHDMLSQETKWVCYQSFFVCHYFFDKMLTCKGGRTSGPPFSTQSHNFSSSLHSNRYPANVPENNSKKKPTEICMIGQQT